MGFVRIKDGGFFFGNRELRFAGLGIGSWLNMEHFMLGMPTPDSMIREAFGECFGQERAQDFFRRFVEEFVQEEDFAYLKELGINLVRVPFNYRLFLDDQHPGTWKEEGFRYFDRLLGFCRKYEIFLLPDLHAVPGGENPDWHSDNRTGIPQFWHYRVFREQMTALWRTIAERYSEEEFLLGYDLLNEPFLMPAADGMLQEFYEETTAAIREVDRNHIIFLEGDFFAMDFSAVRALKDEQTAVTFHFYPTVWEPDLADASCPAQRRQRVFEERFTEMIRGMKRFGRPLLCGEAGYGIRGAELGHVMEMTEDTLELFARHGISWTLWCYKDAAFMGVVRPEAGTPWMKFAEQIHAQWDHQEEMKMGRELIDAAAALFPGETPEALRYQLQFRQRAILFVLQKEQILKPLLREWGWERIRELPESFRMQNCEICRPYETVLKRHLRKNPPDGGNREAGQGKDGSRRETGEEGRGKEE